MGEPLIDSLQPMESNPGGDLAPVDVVGRDAFIEQLWERLKKQSVQLNAERRIGKTQVDKKMRSMPAAGWKPVYQNLEGVKTPAEFAELVYDEVQKHLGTKNRAFNRVQRFLEENTAKYKDVELGLKERSWQDLINAAMGDLLAARQEGQDRVVFFWDELPVMLQNILRGEHGIEQTNTLLSFIRSLSDSFPDLRVVLTGSIGIHHIIAQLRKARIPADPLNKFYATTLEPLSPAWGAALAHALIRGEKLKFPEINAAARAFSESVDHFPFYIHNVIASWKQEDRTGGAPEIRAFVQEQIVAANDPWRLTHFRDRIITYYPDNHENQLAHEILNTLAQDGPDDHPPQPQSVEEIQNRIATNTDRQKLQAILEKLENDHYLKRTANGAYLFRFPLIRRWWRLHT